MDKVTLIVLEEYNNCEISVLFLYKHLTSQYSIALFRFINIFCACVNLLLKATMQAKCLPTYYPCFKIVFPYLKVLSTLRRKRTKVNHILPWAYLSIDQLQHDNFMIYCRWSIICHVGSPQNHEYAIFAESGLISDMCKELYGLP